MILFSYQVCNLVHVCTGKEEINEKSNEITETGIEMTRIESCTPSSRIELDPDRVCRFQMSQPECFIPLTKNIST